MNAEKGLQQIPSAQHTAHYARHLDNAVIQQLEKSRHGDEKTSRASKKIPSGYSLTKDETIGIKEITDEIDIECPQ